MSVCTARLRLSVLETVLLVLERRILSSLLPTIRSALYGSPYWTPFSVLVLAHSPLTSAPNG